MTVLHMHEAMARKALMQAKYTEGLADQPGRCAARACELVRSGAVDYADRWQPVVVTDADRETAVRLLTA